MFIVVDPVEKFVAENPANCIDKDLDEFETDLDFDEMSDADLPLLVYWLKGQLVGWWDWDNDVGFSTQEA